jgi:hypothetical protein
MRRVLDKAGAGMISTVVVVDLVDSVVLEAVEVVAVAVSEALVAVLLVAVDQVVAGKHLKITLLFFRIKPRSL